MSYLDKQDPEDPVYYLSKLDKPDKRTALLKWKLSDKHKNEWKRLNEDVPKYEAYDCAYNSLAVLGIIKRDFAEKKSRETREMYLSLENKKNMKGTSHEELAEMISNYFHKETLLNPTLRKFAVDLDDFGNLKKILEPLKKNEYTLALFNRNGKPGHAVIITKDKQILHIFDPQQQHEHCETNDLDSWIKRNQFTDVDLLFSTKKPNIATTHHNIIRKQTTEHTAKKRRTTKFMNDKRKTRRHTTQRNKLSIARNSRKNARQTNIAKSKSKSSSAMSIMTPPKSSSAMSVMTPPMSIRTPPMSKRTVKLTTNQRNKTSKLSQSKNARQTKISELRFKNKSNKSKSKSKSSSAMSEQTEF
jgi:hypothetical protein